jgi:hypothetical protein
MSAMLAVKVRDLELWKSQTVEKLDKLEKAVTLLKKHVSHLERSPGTKSGVSVPQTPLPDTLEKLEIGSQPEGA